MNGVLPDLLSDRVGMGRHIRPLGRNGMCHGRDKPTGCHKAKTNTGAKNLVSAVPSPIGLMSHFPSVALWKMPCNQRTVEGRDIFL